MNNNDENLIEGHEYDGIQELDNPLPKWWLYLFYATIFFAIGYYSYYQFLGGPSLDENLTKSMAQIEVQHKSTVPNIAKDIEINIEDLLANKKLMREGKETFQQTCAACHGANGEGVIGPNLTDNSWISSNGDFSGILKAIREGFPQKGMPPWKDVIPQAKHASNAGYVLSLRGTTPKNPKSPQGRIIK